MTLQYAMMGLALVGGFTVAAVTALSLIAPKTRDGLEYLQDLDEVEVAEDYKTMLTRPIQVRITDWLKRVLSNRRRRDAGMLRSYRRDVQRELFVAGQDHRLIPEIVLVAQVLAAGLSFALGLALEATAMGFGLTGWVMTAVLTMVGSLLPRYQLRRLGATRSERIARDLPDVVELASMGIKAGLAIDAALGSVIRDFPGPLADELQRMLDDIALGVPRRQALNHVKDRTDVHSLIQLITTLTQAEEMGMPIAAILRTAAAEARLRRQQEAREAAAKLPVKMLMPLVFCIFPPVLVIIIGPAMNSIQAALN